MYGQFAAAPPTRSVPAKRSFPVQNTAGSRMKTPATAVVKAVSRAPVNAPVLNDSVSNSPGGSHTFTAAEVNVLRGFLETIPEHILKNSTTQNFGQYIMKNADHLVSCKGMTQTQVGYRVRAAFPDLIAKATTGNDVSEISNQFGDKKLLFTSNVKQKSLLNVQVPTARDNTRELAGQFQLAGSDDNTQPQSSGTGISITNRIFSKGELRKLRHVLYTCKSNLKVCNNQIFGQTIFNLTKGLINFKGVAKSDVGKYVRAAFPKFKFKKYGGPQAAKIGKLSRMKDVGGGGHGTAGTGAGTNHHSNVPSALDDDSTSIHTYSTEELHILHNILKSCSVQIKRGYTDKVLGKYIEKQAAGAVSFEGLLKSEIGRSVRAAFPDCRQQNQLNEVFVSAAKLKLFNMDIPTQKDDDQQCGIDGSEGNSQHPELDSEYQVEMSLADLHLKPKQMNLMRAKAISLLANHNSMGLTNTMFGKYMRAGLHGKISFDPFNNSQVGYLISVTLPHIVEGPRDGAKRLAAKYSKQIPRTKKSVSSAKAAFPKFKKYGGPQAAKIGKLSRMEDVGGGGQFSGHGTAGTGAGTNHHSNVPSALDDDSTSIHTYSTEELHILHNILKSCSVQIKRGYTDRLLGKYIEKQAAGAVSFEGLLKSEIGRSVRAAFPDCKQQNQINKVFVTAAKLKFFNMDIPTQKYDDQQCGIDGTEVNSQDPEGDPDQYVVEMSLDDLHLTPKQMDLVRAKAISLLANYNNLGLSNTLFGKYMRAGLHGKISFDPFSNYQVGYLISVTFPDIVEGPRDGAKRLAAKYSKQIPQTKKSVSSAKAAFPEFKKYGGPQAAKIGKLSRMEDVGGGGQLSGHGTPGTGAGTNHHSNVPSVLDDDSTSIHTYSTEELHILDNILKSCSAYIKRGHTDKDFGKYIEKQAAGAVSFEGLLRSEIGRSVRAAFPDCKQQNQINKVFVTAAKLKFWNMDIPTQKDDEQQCGIDGTEVKSQDPELDPEYMVEMSLADLHLKPTQMKLVRAKAISLLANYNHLGLSNTNFGKYMRAGLHGKISFDPFSNYHIGYLISVTFPDIVEGPRDGAKRLAAKYSKQIPQTKKSASSAKAAFPEFKKYGEPQAAQIGKLSRMEDVGGGGQLSGAKRLAAKYSKQIPQTKKSVSSAKASHDGKKHKPHQLVPYQQTNQFAEYDQMGASSRYPAYMYDDPVEYMPRPDLYDDPVEYRPRPDLYDVNSPALMPARAREKRRYPWPDDDDIFTTYSHPPPVCRRSYTRVTSTHEYNHRQETSASPAPALMSQETDRALMYPPPSYQGDVETRPSFIHSPPSYPPPPKRDVETDSVITHHPSRSREAIEDRELKDIQTIMNKLDEERDKLAAKLKGLEYMVQDKQAKYY